LVPGSLFSFANFDAGFQKLKAETKLDETVDTIFADTGQGTGLAALPLDVR